MQTSNPKPSQDGVYNTMRNPSQGTRPGGIVVAGITRTDSETYSEPTGGQAYGTLQSNHTVAYEAPDEGARAYGTLEKQQVYGFGKGESYGTLTSQRLYNEASGGGEEPEYSYGFIDDDDSYERPGSQKGRGAKLSPAKYGMYTSYDCNLV